MLTNSKQPRPFFNTNEQLDYISIENLFGVNTSCKNSMVFLSDSVILYIAGSCLVKLDIESLKQNIITFRSKGKFQCMDISSNKKYVLLVDLEQSSPCLLLIDLKPESSVKSIVCLRKTIPECTGVKSVAISSNMEIILCQTNADSNWALMVFSFMRFKFLAETHPISNIYTNDQTVETVSFLPNENKKFLLIGHRLVKIFQYINKNLIKLITNIECLTYLNSHARFNKTEHISFDKFANFYMIDTKQNTVKYLNLTETKQAQNSLTQVSSANSKVLAGQDTTEKYAIRKKHKLIPSVVCTTEGFFLTNQSDFVNFYKQEGPNTFTISYTIKLPNPSSAKTKEYIIKIDMNEAKTALIALTTQNIIYCYRLTNYLKNFESRSYEFEILVQNYHYEPITSIDSCTRKPLIVSCSFDRSLVIWNHDTKSVELRQQFDHDLFSVAFHPSGMYLIVCTTNTLNYMKICLDSVQVLNALNMRNCTNCCFSNGGHMFAFVHGTVVQIYSSVRYVEMGAIKAQEMGKIKQLKFTRNDNYLIACSMAGIVKIWNCYDLTLAHEIITKGLSYIGLALHPNQEEIFLISTEKTVRQFKLPFTENCKSMFKAGAQAKLTRKLELKSTDENSTCVEVSKSGKILCVGTNKGYLKVFLLATGTYKEYRAHSSSLTKICIAFNDECLVTASEDGTLIMWLINKELRYHDVDIDYKVTNHTASHYDTLTFLEQELVLTNKNDFLIKSQQILKIEEKIDELNFETEFKLRLKELKFKLKKKELKSRFSGQKVSLKKQIGLFLDEKKMHYRSFEQEYELRVASHLKNIQSLHQMLLIKINNEKEKNLDLSFKISTSEASVKEAHLKINEIHLGKIAKQYENVESIVRNYQKNHLEKLNDLNAELDEMIKYEDLLEDELAIERGKLVLKNQMQLFELNEENKVLIDQLKNLKKEINSKRGYILEISTKSEKDNEECFSYLSKIKELDALEKKLKQEYETKNESITNQKEENELQTLIESLEILRKSHENYLEMEIKTKIEPLTDDNNRMKKNLNEIDTEIKQNKGKITRMKNEIKSFKSIFKVKYDELKELNEKNKLRILSTKKISIQIKQLAIEENESEKIPKLFKKKKSYNL